MLEGHKIWKNLHLKKNYLETLKFKFSKKATQFDKIFTVDLTVTTYCQIVSEDFFNFRGLLRKRELYNKVWEYF
jgi:hypothetical protein